MTKRRNRYKFTKKKRSIRGILAFVLALAAAAALAVTILFSFRMKGNGSVYLGSAGVLSVIFSISAVILSVLAVREEDTYKAVPWMALILSSIMSVTWITVYGIGFMC